MVVACESMPTHYKGVLVVSEPDPQKIEKEGLVNQLGWKCTWRPAGTLSIGF